MTAPAPNGRCRTCLRPVLIARTEAHNRLFLLDPEPDPAGNQAAFKDPQDLWRTRQLGKDDRPYSFETRHMPHLVTCPGQQKPRAPAALPPNVIPISRAPSKRGAQSSARK